MPAKGCAVHAGAMAATVCPGDRGHHRFAPLPAAPAAVRSFGRARRAHPI